MALRKTLAEVCGELPQQWAWRWVRPELYHLTLAFLGECDRHAYPRIVELGARAAGTVACFPVECAGLGTFPKGGTRPRVLWAGIRPNVSMDRLTQVLDPIGSESAKAHHLTLARRKKGKFGPFGMPSRLASRSWGEWLAEELQLIESELTRSEPVYKVRERWRLGEQ